MSNYKEWLSQKDQVNYEFHLRILNDIAEKLVEALKNINCKEEPL